MLGKCHVINLELLSRVSIQPLKLPSMLALLDKTVLYTSVFAVCDSYCESFLMSRSQNLYLPHKHFTSDLHYTFNIAINVEIKESIFCIQLAFQWSNLQIYCGLTFTSLIQPQNEDSVMYVIFDVF